MDFTSERVKGNYYTEVYLHNYIAIGYCILVGLAKIFGEKSAKPHGGNWVKM